MKKAGLPLILLALLLPGLAGCAPHTQLAPEHPVTLTIWHVYGSQTISPLNDAIQEFNKTEGKERGIIVNVTSVTDSTAIDEALMASARGEPGAAPLPDLFVAYPRIAEQIGTERLLDWHGYFQEEELELYLADFLAEGVFGDRLLMLPIAKSSELLFLNRTIFDRFSADTGVTVDALATFAGVFSACDRYYDWSGGQTMFQINDFYHYFVAAVDSLGGDFLKNGQPDTESTPFATAYEPMARAAVYGGLCVQDGYASDRWKTGEIICNIGSTAGILYLRDYVTRADNSTEAVETAVLAYPVFEGGAPVVVQRGGGLFAVKSADERKNEAAAIFAKWITQGEHNLAFATKSGYLPVTDAAYRTLFSDMRIVENEKYRMLYETIGSMQGEYRFCALPLYEGAGRVQNAFEEAVRSALSSAREAYVRRTAAGEDAAAVMDELVAAGLREIQNGSY